MNHEATLYEAAGNSKVRCTACSRYCILNNGQIGFCGVRKNDSGRLDLLAYGRPIAVQIDPIEKKPILHRYQGSIVYSLGTAGCNFACQFCQNYEVSQRRKIEGSYFLTPQQVVQNALDSGSDGIAFTYNEPTIFMEYAKDIGLLAKESGLFTVFVSNGFETPEAISELEQFLDCITVDFKGNASINFYRRYMSVPSPDFIFDALMQLSKTDIHVEITDLVVPDIGDSIEDAKIMVRKVRDIFGDSIPISFLRFHPDYRLFNLPFTPTGTLLDHYKAAREEGMKYVYIGNVPGNKYQSTYCPNCSNVCVERDLMRTVSFNLTTDGKCKECGYGIDITSGNLSGKKMGNIFW